MERARYYRLSIAILVNNLFILLLFLPITLLHVVGGFFLSTVEGFDVFREA